MRNRIVSFKDLLGCIKADRKSLPCMFRQFDIFTTNFTTNSLPYKDLVYSSTHIFRINPVLSYESAQHQTVTRIPNVTFYDLSYRKVSDNNLNKIPIIFC